MKKLLMALLCMFCLTGVTLPAVTAYAEEKTIIATPSKPTVTNIVDSIRIKWDAVEGVEKYGLWRSETGKNGTYEWIGNPPRNNYRDYDVTGGKTYFYKVTCMDPVTKKHGAKSEAGGVAYVDTPDITGRYNKAAGVVLEWNKIDGATGYGIYRKSYAGTDQWERIATVGGNTTFTYTDTEVKNNNGTIYRYTVRALAGSDMKTLSGCRNTGRTMVRLTSRTLNSAVATAGDSVKCSWTTTSQATGYEVRFMVGSEVIKTVTVGNYKTGVKTFTGLTPDTTYKVQVRSYKKVDGVGSFYSAWSVAKMVLVHEHNYVDEVTAEANCSETGVITGICSVCNDVRIKEIPINGEHVWDNGTIVYNANCTRKGLKVYKCTKCGVTQNEDIPINGEHNWGDGKLTVAPTSNTEGIYFYTCSYCDETKTENIGTYDFNPDDYGNPLYICTSNNPDNYVEFSIEGSKLIVSGKLDIEGLRSVWVRCGDDGDPIPVKRGESFCLDFSLEGVTEKAEVTVYTKYEAGGSYWSYVWREIFVEPTDSGYRFVRSMVLDHNVEVMSHWVNPETYRSDNISEQLVRLSNEIVGNETDEYKKLYMLNYWVAENIYYDYDYYYNRENGVYTGAEDVYEQKRTVCAGYANLLQKLIQAQGIPCKQTSTYSAGVSTQGFFDETNYMVTSTNHAHVEAYVGGRWVAMDPTWDSKNRYENGEYIYKKTRIRFFDVTLDYISYSHKLIRR